MAIRGLVGAFPAELTDPTGLPAGRCRECGRDVVLARPLDPLEVAFCRGCAALCVLRGLAWVWLNPDHRFDAERLALPLDGLAPLPRELASAIRQALTFN